MPEAKSSESKATATAAKAPPAQPELTPAGQSTDPAVHHLVAELETHRANGDTDLVAGIVDYLKTLGYSAG